jgi:hypothetical protein
LIPYWDSNTLTNEAIIRHTYGIECSEVSMQRIGVISSLFLLLDVTSIACAVLTGNTIHSGYRMHAYSNIHVWPGFLLEDRIWLNSFKLRLKLS